MSFTLADLKAVLEDNDESVGHVKAKHLLRNDDGTYVKDENARYVWGEYEPSEFEDDWTDIGSFPIVLNGVEYKITQKDQTGGMDEGSAASVVFEIDGRHFRKSGYYASHYGYDWDGDLEEVEPFEKTVTDYRPV